MSFKRIKGIFWQEYYITKRSMEVIVDLYYWSVIAIIVFGLEITYLSNHANRLAVEYLFLGLLLWEIVRITQYSISVGALWNVWSRNLSNMFISPLSLVEYFTAQMLSGLVKAISTFTVISFVGYLFFDFQVLRIGLPNIFLHFINLTIFAWWVGLSLLAVIFRYGTRIQALAWSIVFLFQPLAAVFFPIDVLPRPLQMLAQAFPATHVFEAARFNLESTVIRWDLIGIAFVENVLYFALAIWFFNQMYKRSRETGQFARNEG